MTTAYATRADLADLFGEDEVSQRESVLPAGAVDQRLADASAMIDGYVSGRYSVPLQPVPAVIPQVACTIARYNLLGESASDAARNNYKDALLWLKDVQAGRFALVGAAQLPGNTDAATVLYTSSPSVFKRAGRP
jgi:phage gp36-like protein